MRKLKIVIINILLIFIIFCFFEFLFFKCITKYTQNKPKYNIYKKNFSLKEMKKNAPMREPSGLQYKKKPILIYGCSYAYGYALDNKDSFGFKLSEYAKRPVYNFAMPAKGLQHAYLLLKDDIKIFPEPEYIFYVFMNDHFRRMYINCDKTDKNTYLTFKNVNGKLVLNKNTFNLTDRFYTLSCIKDKLYFLRRYLFKNEINNLGELYFVSIQEEILKKYPDTKFIIIDYNRSSYSVLNNEMKKRLIEKGIEIISVYEIFGGKLQQDYYKNSIDTDIYMHPNAKAWELIIKYITEKYNL